MNTWRSLSLFPSGIVLGAAMVVGQAGAQTCAAPSVLTVNESTFFNTCLSGDNSLVVACGMFALTGPALVIRMPLPYPIGQISVQSASAGYDPALFLLRAQCGNNAPCGYAVDSGSVVDTLDLAQVDSGDYLLAIAPFHFESSSCGQILVTHSMTPQQQALARDGVFRGGTSAPSPNL